MSNVQIISDSQRDYVSGNFSITREVSFILSSQRKLSDPSDCKVPSVIIPANTEISITQHEHDRAVIIGQPTFGRVKNFYCDLAWDGGKARIGAEWGFSHVTIADIFLALD